MSSINKVILLGRVGKDPEVRSLDNGTQVASFSVATSEKFKDKTTGEQKETTEWSNVTAWRKTAEIVGKYVKKGDLIYVEGKLKTRSWEKDGVTKYATDIIADNVVLIGGKNGGSQNSNNTNQQGEPSFTNDGTSTGDLPF